MRLTRKDGICREVLIRVSSERNLEIWESQEGLGRIQSAGRLQTSGIMQHGGPPVALPAAAVLSRAVRSILDIVIELRQHYARRIWTGISCCVNRRIIHVKTL